MGEERFIGRVQTLVPLLEGLGVGFGAATTVVAAFLSRAILVMTSNASGASVAVITGTPGLMMPAFSAAISSSVLPAISDDRTGCW